MFQQTFSGCSGLTSIPSGLFDSIDTSSATDTSYMFYGTFGYCSGLTSLPATMFDSNISMANASSYSNMFYQMFFGCSNLSGYIPSTLFPSGLSPAKSTFSYAFYNTQLAESCPAGTALYDTYPNSKVACSICPAGQYSAAGASSCSNVTAGYFCSGGCTTATPTSNSDCLSGYSCGQCLTDSATGRQAYSDAGASSCSVCPAVTGALASRLRHYNGWWPNNIHTSVGGCYVSFDDDDPDATYSTTCFYSTRDEAYGGSQGYCQIFPDMVYACVAGKYSTISSLVEYYGVDSMKGRVCTPTDAGYYSPEGALTQTACPTGYNANNATGKSAISQCQTSCAAGNYMASGTYTRLEYLTSSGTQYIDTGIKQYYKQPLTVEFSFKPTELTGWMLGNAYTQTQIVAENGFSVGSVGVSKVTYDADSIEEIYYNNTLKMTTTWDTNAYDNLPIMLFALGWNQGVSDANMSLTPKGSMYYAKIWEDDVLVRDMIPVRRNSDSVLGMLDLVSGQFFTNAGSGTFTAGPDVGVIGGTCTSTTAGYYATAATVGYGTPAPQTQCSAGTYSGAGSASCSTCSAGTYSTGGAAACTACGEGYNSSAGASSCTGNTINVRWDDGNGGTLSTMCTYGEDLTTPTTVPTAPRGHHFVGWSW